MDRRTRRRGGGPPRTAREGPRTPRGTAPSLTHSSVPTARGGEAPTSTTAPLDPVRPPRLSPWPGSQSLGLPVPTGGSTDPGAPPVPLGFDPHPKPEGFCHSVSPHNPSLSLRFPLHLSLRLGPCLCLSLPLCLSLIRSSLSLPKSTTSGPLRSHSTPVVPRDPFLTHPASLFTPTPTLTGTQGPRGGPDIGAGRVRLSLLGT